MGTRRLVLLVALAAAILPLGLATAHAQDTGGSVVGTVYHDLDGDGVRDDGEPGLGSREVALQVGTRAGGRAVTDASGVYAFELGADDYTVEVVLDVPRGLCVDVAFSFHPLSRSFCVSMTNPWKAVTPAWVQVTVAEGERRTVDFGIQPREVVTVAGNALIEDAFAPLGTTIEALVGGQVCGQTRVEEDELGFSILVLGADERPGCARRGATVTFRVAGRAARETATWSPFHELTTPGGFLRVDLVAMRDHAWYWAHPDDDFVHLEGARVEARVGGVLCGETTLEIAGIEGAGPGHVIAGFSRLVVPSESVQPGCGRPGTTVSFSVGGSQVGSAVWQAGLHELALDLPGPAAATPPPRLPTSGLGPGTTPRSATQELALLLAWLAADATAIGLALALRR